MKKKTEKIVEPEIEQELDTAQLAQIRDVPEPGSEPPARLPEAEVTFLGFDTYHTARGHLSNMHRADKHRIVRVVEMNNIDRVLGYFIQERPE